GGVPRGGERLGPRHLREGGGGSGGVLGGVRAGAGLDPAVADGAGVDAAAREVVRGREAERGVQLPGPAPGGPAAEQGGAGVGGGAGGRAGADVLGPAPGGVEVRERAA